MILTQYGVVLTKISGVQLKRRSRSQKYEDYVHSSDFFPSFALLFGIVLGSQGYVSFPVCECMTVEIKFVFSC